jgi:hypothetical protein
MTIQRINGSRGHWYKIDGKKADGVTTLIGKGMPKPALPYWSAKSVAEHVADNLDTVAGMRDMGRDSIIAALKGVPWSQRDAAAKRGTEVHSLAEQLIHGAEVEVPDELAGHVESYVKFLDEWQPRPVLVEKTVAHRQWRYSGTFDSVLDLPDGRRVIADIKTSRSGIFAETALQLAAYRYAQVYLDDDGAEKPMEDLKITGGLGIWIRADGYDVLPVECGEREFKDFLHVAWVARTADRFKDASPVGEALSAPVAVAS